MGDTGKILREELAREAEREFLWLVVAFCGGIVLFFFWASDPAAWITAAICALGFEMLALRDRLFGASFIAMALIAVGLGHGAAVWRTARVATPLLER